MAKKAKDFDPLHPLEIIVSTYWPTRVVKDIKVTDPLKDNWHNDITLTKAQAQYLYDQLTPIFSKVVLSDTTQPTKQKEQN